MLASTSALSSFQSALVELREVENKSVRDRDKEWEDIVAFAETFATRSFNLRGFHGGHTLASRKVGGCPPGVRVSVSHAE